MRILFIAGWILPPWMEGTTISILRLIKKLNKKHEIFVLTNQINPRTKEKHLSEEKLFGINFVRIPIKPRNFFKIKKMIKEIDPDVISVHSSSLNFAIFSALLSKKPKMLTVPAVVHSRLKFGLNKISTFFQKILQKRLGFLGYKKIVGTSKELAQGLNSMHLPYGISVKGSKFISRRSKKKQTIAFVSPMRRKRGFFVFLDALRELKSRGHDFKAIIVYRGSLGLTPEIKKKIQEYDLEKNIEIHGEYIKDMPKFLRRADILVNPLLKEAKATQPPMILLEGMLSGILAIATPYSGQSELIIDGETGFLVKPKTEDLVPVLENAMNNYGKLGKLRKNARKKIIDDYSIDKIADKYVDLFGELMFSQYK